jgi:hypothetical protein
VQKRRNDDVSLFFSSLIFFPWSRRRDRTTFVPLHAELFRSLLREIYRTCFVFPRRQISFDLREKAFQVSLLDFTNGARVRSTKTQHTHSARKKKNHPSPRPKKISTLKEKRRRKKKDSNKQRASRVASTQPRVKKNEASRQTIEERAKGCENNAHSASSPRVFERKQTKRSKKEASSLLLQG